MDLSNVWFYMIAYGFIHFHSSPLISYSHSLFKERKFLFDYKISENFTSCSIAVNAIKQETKKSEFPSLFFSC